MDYNNKNKKQDLQRLVNDVNKTEVIRKSVWLYYEWK